VAEESGLQIGDVIGGFKLQSRLGEGGMGVVWLAEETEGEKRRAALKVLPTDLAQNEELRERFLREGKYATRVKHPNIGEVYAAGEQDGLLWLAMRYLEGTDLATILRRGGALQPRRALSIVGQVAAALDEADKAGLLHRDIKPANIMLASGNGEGSLIEQAYVIDFGLGKAPQTDEQGLTKPGQFVGTIDYTAPELITQAETLTGRVDQYSLGCVLYEMLTGEVPFPKKRDVEVIMAHVSEPPPKASEKREGLPPAIDDVIAKAMAKEPDERYASCTEMFEAATAALRSVADEELESAKPEGADTVWLMPETGEQKGKPVPVAGERFVIGRDETADLQIIDTRMSRKHASLKVLPGGNAELRDLDSANGTLVNGAPVKAAVLTGGEKIRLGDSELTFYPVDPIRAKTTVGLTAKPRLSQIVAKRGQSAIQRLRIEKKLRNLTIAAGAAILAVVVLGALLATGIIGGGGPDTSAVVAKAGPSTVLVTTDRGPTGSGWTLDAGKGLVVTNAHVVNDGTSFKVGVQKQQRAATVVAVAPCEDLAVLEVTPNTGLRTLPLGRQSDIKEGDTVVALGYPQSASLDARLTATTGVVSVAKTTYRETAPDVPQYANVVQIDAAINPGNSGGPLVNLDSRLIGVNSAVVTERGGRAIQGQNYAIGVDRVRQTVDYLRTGKSLGWVGINFGYPTTQELQAEGGSGLKYLGAVKGSPAADAGIETGEYIAGVNGTQVQNTIASWCNAAGALQSGQTATLTVLNPASGRTRQVELKVP